MQNLDLPNIKVKIQGDQVEATHKRNGAKLLFPIKQLESWLIRKFRDDFTMHATKEK